VGPRLALAAALTLAGCVHHTSLYGEVVPAGCSAEGPRGSERCMGWWIDRTKMLTEQELVAPELGRYVDSVANRVARAAGDHRNWHVRILDTSDIQAEANIWTTLYITRGALGRMRDEAELAAVLGHEIGHVIAGHMLDGVLEHDRGVREASRDLEAERDDEAQADDLAVKYCALAGYDVTAPERMLRALAAGDPSDDPDRGSDPHPRWNQRLARVQAFAMHFSQGGATNAAEFTHHLEGLVVGEDPREDALLVRTAVFSTAEIAIDLPDDAVGGTAWRSVVTVTFKDDTELRMRMVSAHAAAILRSTGDTTYTLVPAGERMLMISVTGTDRATLGARVRKLIRKPVPSEIGQLTPKFFDPSEERALWPATG
jgi:predicted Zn-dependent protease